MHTLSDEQKLEIIAELKKNGCSEEEVIKIFQARQEKEEGKIFSSEEVFEYVLQKDVTYA